MPAAVSGAGGHEATFRAALAVTRGFGLSGADARRVMDEYNARCQPPWKPHELEHKLASAARSGAVEMGYLLKGKGGPSEPVGGAVRAARVERPAYDEAELDRFYDPKIDELYFADRSAVDPATIGPRGFLELLYRKDREKIVCFTNSKSQGEAVWPDERPPFSGPDGVWFLTAPVDGEFRPNRRAERGRDGKVKMSRRIAECALRFPYMVVESDDAPPEKWLSLLAALPAPIDAVYTSGGRSVHALVRIGARTPAEFNQIKERMRPGLGFLAKCGLDWRCITPMRLSRLPGCRRGGKFQKLLYINPGADARPIREMPPLRDAVADWLAAARCGISDADAGRGLLYPLRHYAPHSPQISEVLQKLESEKI